MKLLASQIVAFVHQLPTPLSKMIQAPTTTSSNASWRTSRQAASSGISISPISWKATCSLGICRSGRPPSKHGFARSYRSLIATTPVRCRKILRKAATFSKNSTSAFPAQRVRHDLGELYTPDWLAEYLLDRLEYNGNPDVRLLDPACGSGTFLVMWRFRGFGVGTTTARSAALTKASCAARFSPMSSALN